jgi:O-antigen/teichoic acid export membrane protein
MAPWSSRKMLRKLARHVSNYSVGNLLMMISGLISFPIFTRIFTVDEYGVLNLISATLALLIGIAKLGVQHSIVRFYGEVKAGKRAVRLSQYHSTTFFGMLAVAMIVTVVWAIASQLIPSSWWNDQRVAGLLLLTSVLVIVRSVDSCLSNFLRAEERSGFFSIYGVAKRYVGLAIVLFAVFYVARNLYGFYVATIITETGAVILLLALLSRGRYSPREFSPSLFLQMLKFGVPMIAFELAGVILNIGDRYIIQGVLGSTALGIYSAGYNFCEYVQIILLSSIGQAIMPMYVRSWEEHGEEQTRRIVGQVLYYYLMIALPVIAGLSAVGEDLLVFLASEKYRESATIIPYIIAGMAIDSMVVIVGAGLYIHKRTLIIASLVAGCAALNVLLNVLLVPHFGIVGAGIATLISYAALTISILWASNRTMPIPFPWASAVKFGGMATIMYVVVTHLPTSGNVVTFVGRVVVGVLLYSAMVLTLDGRARAAIRAGIDWCRMRF